MKKILVLGGSGFVGRHVCEKLVRQQCRVTVATRRAGNAQALQMLPLLDVVPADIHDPDALTRLVAGHDAVVHLVAILHGTPAAFGQVHVELVRKLVAACQRAGVPRIVHLSALGATADAASHYQRSKAAGEAVLAASGLDVCMLRPSVIFGAGDRLLNLFARLQAVFPVMPLAAADARFQPVWVEDVAQAVLHCLDIGGSAAARERPPIYEACGPEVLSLRQLVQWAGSLSGHPRPVIGLPDALGRLQALLMEWAPGPTLMSRDNLDAMRVDNVASGRRPGLQALGIQPASIAAIAPTYLGQGGPRTALLGLRKTAGR